MSLSEFGDIFRCRGVFSVPRCVRILEGSLLGGPRIVAAIVQAVVAFRSTRVSHTVDISTLSLTVSEPRVAFRCTRCATIIANRAVSLIDGLATCSVIRNARITISNRALIGCWSAVVDRATVGNRETVIDRTLVSNGALISHTRIVSRLTIIRNGTTVSHTRIVACMTLVGNRPTVSNRPLASNVTLVGYRTAIVDWSTVMMALIRDSTVTGNRSGTCGRSCSGSGRCTGSGFGVAVGISVGVEFIGVLEFAFVLESLFLGETITFRRVGVQLLRLGGLALGLCSLNLGVGVGLLRFGLAMLSVGFPGMDFMLGFGGFLADPGCFLALVLALLSCGLTTDRDNDADDNQNYDDRNDYPDDGSCTHSLSPCCLFGSH